MTDVQLGHKWDLLVQEYPWGLGWAVTSLEVTSSYASQIDFNTDMTGFGVRIDMPPDDCGIFTYCYVTPKLISAGWDVIRNVLPSLLYEGIRNGMYENCWTDYYEED